MNDFIFRLFNPNGGAVPLPPNAHHFPPLPIPPSGNGAAHSSHLPSPHHLVPIHPPHPGNGLTNAVMPSPLGAASAALLQHHHQQQHQLLQVSLKQYRKENFLETFLWSIVVSSTPLLMMHLIFTWIGCSIRCCCTRSSTSSFIWSVTTSTDGYNPCG